MIRRVSVYLAAFGCVAAGVAAGMTPALASGLVPPVTHLSAGSVAGTAVAQVRRLRIVTRSLASGIKGLSYLQVLSASGGVTPYTWSAAGLPRGLTLSKGGVISGYPRSTRASTVTLRVRDARHTSRQRKLRLRVPTSLPAGCIARSCALLSPDGHTIQIPKPDITSVTRSAKSGKVTQVRLSGISVAKGDVLVLAPATGIPSGLIAVANSVKTGGGTSTVAVTTATPADAYHLGIVQALGKAATATRKAAPNAALSCKGGVTSDLHGLTVTPSLKPTVAAYWKHPLFGGIGIFAGLGGLRLFQFDLTGTITVNLGVSVSGKATCKLDLPGIDETVPAGELGAVFLQLDPSLTLTTTGQVDLRTSVTLTCDAQFRWDQGKSSRADFCTAAHQPLRLSAGSGIDATVTGAIDASVSLDDLPGINGTIDASLHAGYHPAQHPVAEIDAKSEYDLNAVLFNFWKGGPKLTIAHGTIFDKILATYDSKPPGPGGGGKPSITVSPGKAFPWNDAACGFNNPTFGSITFTVSGKGFQPGESVSVSTGWTTYTAHKPTVNAHGDFSVTEPVGEVPSTFNSFYGVRASGSSGSKASASIELNADGCIFQHDNGGNIHLQWAGNGFDPNTTLTLSIDGNALSTVTTDRLGTGGSTADFACPSSGSYTWKVSGNDNGQFVTATQAKNCAPAATAGKATHTTERAQAAAAASS
jgi:hypothetical protein